MFTKKNEKKNENFKSALKHKGTFFHMHCSCNKINSSKLYYVWLQHSPQPVIKRKKNDFFLIVLLPPPRTNLYIQRIQYLKASKIKGFSIITSIPVCQQFTQHCTHTRLWTSFSWKKNQKGKKSWKFSSIEFDCFFLIKFISGFCVFYPNILLNLTRRRSRRRRS